MCFEGKLGTGAIKNTLSSANFHERFSTLNVRTIKTILRVMLVASETCTKLVSYICTIAIYPGF